jgi:hypothetical protein
MMEQQFASYLLDRIDEEVAQVPKDMAQRMQTHLKALRGIVDSLETTSRSRRGGANA